MRHIMKYFPCLLSGLLLLSLPAVEARATMRLETTSGVQKQAQIAADKLVPFPGLEISIDRCYHFCGGVRVDLLLRNVTNSTNDITLFGSNWPISAQKSTFADADGKVYKAQIRNGSEEHWTSNETDLHVPAGLTLRTSVMIEDVPDGLTELALFDLRGAECGPHYNNYQALGHNIPIEAYPQDGADGIVCSMPSIKVDLKSCVRDGNNVRLKFTATNTSEKAIPANFATGRQGVYDADGNVYSSMGLTVNNAPFESTPNFLPGIPVQVVAEVRNVPQSLQQFEMVGLVYPYYEDLHWGIIFSKVDITTPAPKTSSKASTGKKSPARARSNTRR